MIKTTNDVNQINKDQWMHLLRTSSHRSAFQTPECYAFYSDLSFMESFVFGVSEDGVLKGVIVGFILKDGGKIKQYFSRRAIVNGGPLLADDISEEALAALLNVCKKQLKHKAIYVEMRNFENYSTYRCVFEREKFKYCEHYNFHVDTTSLEVVENNMGKSRKRDARVSMRDGAIVEKNPTINDVRSLYSILKNLYEEKVKTPLFPLEFFEKLYVTSFGEFLIVKYNDEVVGGTIVVSDDVVVYEWFACGKDGVYKNIFPSTLATYSGIYYALENGQKRFDMMGAGAPSDGGYGVRDFKSKFGGQLVEYGRFLCVCKPLLYQIGKIGVWLLKHK